MNPAVATILLDFLKAELSKNPALAGDLISKLLGSLKVDPTLAADIVALIEELLPIILGAIK